MKPCARVLSSVFLFAMVTGVGCGDSVPPSTDLDALDVHDTATPADVWQDQVATDNGRWCHDIVPDANDQREILAGPLSNGVLLYSNDSGDLVVAEGERDLLVLPGDVGPVIRTFNETTEGYFGQWRFSRADVVEHPMTFSGVEQRCRLDGHPGDVIAIRWSDKEGTATASLHLYLVEEGYTRMSFSSGGVAADSVAIPLRCGPDDTFHGFGEQYNAIDQRGQAFDLMVSEQGIGRESQGVDDPLWWMTGNDHTTYFPMPYFINMATGSGLLLDTEWRTHVDLCASDPDVAWFEVSSSIWSGFEMFLFPGPGPMEVIRQLGDRVGRPIAVPDWAFSTWLCTQGGPDAVLERIGRARTADIPFGVVWIQDWTGKRTNIGGGSGVQYRWRHDPDYYPDLAGLIEGLHADGIKALAYVNPFVMKNLPDHYTFMENSGMLVSNGSSGDPYDIDSPAGTAGLPDLTFDQARDYVQGQLGAIVEDLGFDGWMVDFGEYFPLDATLYLEERPGAYHNIFPVEWVRQTRKVMEKHRPDGDFVYFARAGYTGVQNAAQIHWVGDQEATWSRHDGLPTVVPAMLNLGLSGQPLVTHDIAGFSGGPSTRELYLRWTELGAFTPLMRTHDGNNRDENWCWDRDEYTVQHFRRMALVHEKLSQDFFIGLAKEAVKSGAPIVRAMMLVFPDDRATWSISDQYMIGDSLLVAPILTPSNPDSLKAPDFETATTARDVYLPEGDWYDVWADDPQAVSGPIVITVQAPFGRPPVFHLATPYTGLSGL